MATRANIVVMKSSDSHIRFGQLYCICGGYPKNLGKHISDCLKSIEPDKLDYILGGVNHLMYYIDEYELIGAVQFSANKLRLSGGIEYLYILDMDKRIVSCYYVYDTDTIPDEDVLEDRVYSLKGVKEIYRCGFFDDWIDVECEMDIA